MNLYVKLIILSIVFDFVLYWIKYQMYYQILGLCKFTRISHVVYLEHYLYKIQILSDKIPFLMLRRNEYNMKDMEHEIYHAVWYREKFLIAIEYIIGFIRKFLGIRIIYIACVLLYTYECFEYEFKSLINNLYVKIIEIDFVAFLQNIYEYLWENGSGLLVLTIIVLLMYIHFLREKKEQYIMERIWDDDIVAHSKEVAQAQKNIHKYIIELHRKLANNMRELKSLIDRMDRWKRFSDKEELFIETENFVEYESVVKLIKQEIGNIEKNEGMTLYVNYNHRIWWQLYQLSLTNSDNKYYYAKEISECDKLALENVLKGVSINKKNYREMRKHLMMRWVIAIAKLNGISRYLKYIKTRKRKFIKTKKRLARVDLAKKIFENVKNNFE